MKKLIVFILLFPLMALAQESFVTHTVEAKESLTSIGRKYNINGRELARYNNLDYEKSLTIGQVIRIPVRSDFNTGKGSYPVFHTVMPKETLYAIHLRYNKVPLEDLRRWNNLQANDIQEGSQLIVGYSDLPNNTARTTPAPPSRGSTAESSVPTKESERPAPQSTAPQSDAVPLVPESTGTFAGGYFKSFFNGQAANRKMEGKAGTFKSTSGWDDGKYYCLHNQAPAGGIVKITNRLNGKVVYAKVLDVIPDLKQNADIVIRVSNAASEELQANGTVFDVIIDY